MTELFDQMNETMEKIYDIQSLDQVNENKFLMEANKGNIYRIMERAGID